MRKIRHKLESLLAHGLMSFFSSIPFQAASFMGSRLARLFCFISARTHTARKNIRHALPGLTADEEDRIISEMWDNLGRNFAELPHMSRLKQDELMAIADIDGVEYLRNVADNDQAILFFTAHLANWEIAPRLFSDLGIPVSIVYRQANNPGLETMVQAARAPYVISTIPKGPSGSRKILQNIKSGRRIGILVDQKMNDGIAIDFFGRKAMTAPAIARLAIKYHCPVIPVRVVRHGGHKFKVYVSPPIEIPGTNNRDNDIITLMSSINKVVENWIRERPGQWIWLHNRWPDA